MEVNDVGPGAGAGGARGVALALTAFLLACSLLAAAWLAAGGGPYPWTRRGLLLLGAGAALVSPRLAILGTLATAPLLPLVSHEVLGARSLSLAQHLLLGTLAPVLLLPLRRGLASGGRVRSAFRWTPLDAAQLLFASVVMASFAGVLVQYARQGAGISDFVSIWLPRAFFPRIGDYAVDRFVVVEGTLVFTEAALWWAALRTQGTGVSARDLRLALLAPLPIALAVLGLQAGGLWPGPDPWPSLEGGALPGQGTGEGTGALPGQGTGALPGLVTGALPRLGSTLLDSHLFGVWLVTLLPLALLAASRAGARAVALPVAAATMLGALAWTTSRSSFVALAAQMVAGAFLVALRPARVGWRGGWVGRALAGGTAVVAVLVAGLAVAMVTRLDLGRGVDRRRASTFLEMAAFSLNLRRDPDEVTTGRTEYWGRALSLWRAHPWTGVGIGRYALWKMNPADGVVARGAGGTGGPTGAGGGVTAHAHPDFRLWLTATGGVDFVVADVLAGDTIESPGAGWGPVRITAVWSPTQLHVESPVPPGAGMDFVVRHPGFDPAPRGHAHRATSPEWRRAAATGWKNLDRAGKRLLYDKEQRRLARMSYWTSAHDFWLHLLAELGVLGLAAFLSILAAATSSWVRQAAGRSDADRPASAAAFLGVFGLLVASLGQDPLLVLEMQLVFQALLFAASRVDTEWTPQDRTPR